MESTATPIAWKSEKRQLAELVPAEYNPRQLTEKQAQNLGESLSKFNLADPIVINKNNRIIGGHQRIKILQGQGVEEVDVRVPDRELTTEEEKELNIRLNKNLGEWDLDRLVDFDEDMLKTIGFTPEELDKIFKEPKRERDAGDVPAERETEIKAGDMFQLGEHTLVCGDATKKEDVAKLMQGEKARVIHTDPPYNVDYGSSKNPRHKIRSIENDAMSTDEWSIFCHKMYEMFKEYGTGDIYMWGASGPEGMRMRLWLVEMGCHWSATIVWKKQQLVLSPAKYQRMYEPCFYGWFGKSSYGDDRKQTEVWEVDRPHSSKLHPTMKPVELCVKAIRNSCAREDIVMDLFGGSGSTLMACELINRKCRMMELDPVYCQVIIDRWEKFTNQKAGKVSK